MQSQVGLPVICNSQYSSGLYNLRSGVIHRGKNSAENNDQQQSVNSAKVGATSRDFDFR